jgi:DMSO/TMAO reductase YedYZ molybdopterin-dependent catalytic subunit
LKPEPTPPHGPQVLDRRRFVQLSLLAGVAMGGRRAANGAGAEPFAELPFANGRRPLVRYPQKRPLLRLTTRPPQLETPFSVFDEGVLTPNDAFFVRYHLTNSPPPEERLVPDVFRLQVRGHVAKALELSMADLKSQFEPAEVVAVNQCSGNSRGFFSPRVPGGQSGNGNMGNARWAGVRLRDVLRKAGVGAGARQVVCDGLDAPLVATTPDYVKALELEHALDGDVVLAYAMNGEELPWLNGYPLRLVVPGHYGTYWIKHVHRIEVVDRVFDGFWMSTAYRIPDNDCACVAPGAKPDKTVPIGRYNVRSFITSLADGASLRRGEPVELGGIAFDGGAGIHGVEVSLDDGARWQAAALGEDLGRYSFRRWTLRHTPADRGPLVIKVRATTRSGETQPSEPRWNPAGYMRNVIEVARVRVV